MHIRDLAISGMSICPSIRHILILSQNKWPQAYAIFTVGENRNILSHLFWLNINTTIVVINSDIWYFNSQTPTGKSIFSPWKLRKTHPQQCASIYIFLMFNRVEINPAPHLKSTAAWRRRNGRRKWDEREGRKMNRATAPTQKQENLQCDTQQACAHRKVDLWSFST